MKLFFHFSASYTISDMGWWPARELGSKENLNFTQISGYLETVFYFSFSMNKYSSCSNVLLNIFLKIFFIGRSAQNKKSAERW